MFPIELRQATHRDYDFLYDLVKATMREYVDRTWGWHEDRQRAYFHEHFSPAEDQIIVLGGQDIGVVSAERHSDRVDIDKLYILPTYQRRGIGTQVLWSILSDAFAQGLPVSLRVLRVNPAKRLYERLGFVQVGEIDTHYLMEAVPPRPVE